MTAPWSIDVMVAGHDWTVTDLDPATPGPTAPLSIRHALPDDQLWPAQPMPMTASLGLVTADAADLSDVVTGAPVYLGFTAPPNPTPVEFAGTVTDVEVEPARFKPDDASPAVDGVRLTVTAIGYLAQLWEEIVVAERNDLPSALDRMWDLFASTPWPDGVASPPGWGPLHLATNYFDNYATTTDYAIDGEALGPHMDALLRVWLWDHDNDGQLVRLVVAPNIDPATRLPDATTPWRLEPVSNAATLEPIATLGDTPKGWGVVAGVGSIDAGKVDRSVRFVQRKRSNVNRVVLPYYLNSDGKQHTLSVSNGDTPTVMHTLGDVEKPILYMMDAAEVTSMGGDIARFYLPLGGADAWGVDTIVWVLHLDEPGKLPPALGQLVTLAPVPETVNPNGRGWVTGLVRGWTLNLPDATVELELATARGIVNPSDTDRLTWDELPATVTWDDLRPDHTWNDADLLRGE